MGRKWTIQTYIFPHSSGLPLPYHESRFFTRKSAFKRALQLNELLTEKHAQYRFRVVKLDA